jgi:hypothetical protein
MMAELSACVLELLVGTGLYSKEAFKPPIYLHSSNFSLAGCPEAALCNILTAVQVASQSGTLGIVVASWSGPHHLTPHPFSWPGFVVAAGLSWNTSTHWVS